MIRILGADFIIPITQFFTYRDAPFQNLIYKHEWKPSTDKIAIIKIDDNSLNALQANSDRKMLTISKKTYIELIEKLESVGVKGIAFDIIFQNKDPDEQLFADTLKKYGNIVIGTTSRCIPETNSDFVISEPHITCDGSIKDSEIRTLIQESEWKEWKYQLPLCYKDNDSWIYTCDGFPRSIYTDAPWGLLQVDSHIYKRSSGIQITQAPFLLSGETRFIPSLSHKLFSITNSWNINAKDSLEILQPFFWKQDSYPFLSLSVILEAKKIDLVKNFSGKYVFIGDTSKANHDVVISPVSNNPMAGVETHAHMLDGLLQNRIPVATSPETLYLVIVILAFLMVGIYFFIPNTFAPIVAGIVFLFTIWIGRFLYGKHDIVFDIFPVMLAGSILSFPLTFIYRFFIVDREKRELQKNFGHYVDPHVVEQIAEKDEDIVLGGEHKDVTVLFSDIAGFTTISEKLEATDLFSLMTSYLSNMTNILIEQWGTLDKYIGDAVMGFFGAPLTLPDHAIRGCRTALLMRERLPAFNADIMKHGMDPIDFRVGMASGDVMVGNIGSQDRFNYTVLGDTVNLASRLEGTGKEYNVHIILSHGTRTGLSDEFFVRELDTIAVKGKSEGVRIYELIGFTKNITDRTIYENYEKALSLYREEKYIDAGRIWESQKDIDPPSCIMMDRCLSLIHGETHLENGVYHMTHK